MPTVGASITLLNTISCHGCELYFATRLHFTVLRRASDADIAVVYMVIAAPNKVWNFTSIQWCLTAQSRIDIFRYCARLCNNALCVFIRFFLSKYNCHWYRFVALYGGPVSTNREVVTVAIRRINAKLGSISGNITNSALTLTDRLYRW